MADLYVAMYAPLVGNHEHWNLQVVVRDEARRPSSRLKNETRSSDTATKSGSSVLQSSRKRKWSSSLSIAPLSSPNPGREDEECLGCEEDFPFGSASSQHDAVTGSGNAGNRGPVLTTATTTVYEVLNQHPDFIASVITTTSPITATGSRCGPPKDDDVLAGLSAALGEDSEQGTSTSNESTSFSTIPANQAKAQHCTSSSSSSSSSPSPPTSLHTGQHRPPLRRLTHLTSLNPADISSIDEIVRSVPVDNETVHWNCQDYVMEILGGLEESCVVGFEEAEGEEERGGDGDGDGSVAEGDGEDVEDGQVGGASECDGKGGESQGGHVAQDHKKDEEDDRQDSSRSRRSDHEGQGQGYAERSSYCYSYTNQKRQLMRYFGPII